MRNLFFLLSMSVCLHLQLCAQAVINEIYPGEDQVEIKNIGRTVINLRGYVLDDGGNGVLNINGNTIFVCGQLELMPGDIAVVEIQSVHTSTSGEFLLRNVAGSPISYVQWGVGLQLLSRTAFNAGIWDGRDLFVKSWQTGGTAELIDENERRNPDGYLEQVEPTMCKENRACVLTDIIVSKITCNDNDTPADVSDDYFTFVLQVEGRNLDDELDVSMSNTSVMPSVLPAGCIDCLFSTDPGTADGSLYTLTVSTTDDYLEYILRVWGLNVSDEYIATYSNGIVIGPFEYGSVQNIDTRNTGQRAGDGDFTLIIQDSENTSCTDEVFFDDPGSCSDQCEYTGASIFNLRCNDNETSQDPSDDFLEFDLETEGFNLGDQYTISMEGTQIRPDVGSHLTITSFATASGSAHEAFYDYRITNIDDPTCSYEDVLLSPGTCSEDCFLSVDSLAFICNNNETPPDSTDDYYQLYISASGTNTSDSFRLSATPLLSAALVLPYDEGHLIDLEKDIDLRSAYALTILDHEKSCVGFTLNGQLQGPCPDDIVSINELSDTEVLIYPNPAHDIIYLEMISVLQDVRVEIMGVNGMRYMVSTLTSRQESLNINSLKEGIYIIRIITPQGNITSRFIKN